MYQDAVSQHKTMGDVDVVYHDGTYHLFHLVLPNHDFIAHAISSDGINWERIENAIFIGHPGDWDDHMLWTMAVSPDPWRPNRWRMFYTGISRRDCGNIQRIGCAYSYDLIHWEKAPDRWVHARSNANGNLVPSLEGRHDKESAFPLEAEAPHYESTLDEGRAWVSFRDPFYFHEDGVGRLLMAARVPEGPVIRRGCVGMLKEVSEGVFASVPALHHPGQYDDIEVPNLFKLGERYYLIGSIREDAKIRYWTSNHVGGPWSNFYDNVLLAGGNYAARICCDDKGPLIWNFYTSEQDRTVRNLMPPPKRLTVRDDGRLGVKSFEAFDSLARQSWKVGDLLPMSRTTENAYATLDTDEQTNSLTATSDAGFEGFLFSRTVNCFRFTTNIHLDGRGKCGFLFRMDPETTSGYHISLDLHKGVAQLRAWGAKPNGMREEAFQFQSLQSGYWQSKGKGPWKIQLLCLQNYIEFSLDGYVLLTLSDETYQEGQMGIYVESACVRLEDVLLESLRPPEMPTDDLPAGHVEIVE